MFKCRTQKIKKISWIINTDGDVERYFKNISGILLFFKKKFHNACKFCMLVFFCLE